MGVKRLRPKYGASGSDQFDAGIAAIGVSTRATNTSREAKRSAQRLIEAWLCRVRVSCRPLKSTSLI